MIRRSGLVLRAGLISLAAGPGFSPGPAGAAVLEPCVSTNPTGPIIDLDGQLYLSPHGQTRQAWRRSGLRQSLIRPANSLTGRPAFPVRKVRYGKTARIRLKGGIRLTHGRHALAVRGFRVVSAPGRSALLKAAIGGRSLTLLRVHGGKRRFNRRAGELTQSGNARLTVAGARLLNRRLRTGERGIRPGTIWGYFNLYALYKVTKVDDPTGETPQEPPVKVEPEGALGIGSAATIKWYVRDSFINYIASGQGTRAAEGATADPPSGPYGLTYSYNFPFSSGWTVPANDADQENTVVKATGLVGFRYCDNTINFTVADPEIELDGDDNSRLIFRVNGTDGTAFPDQRAVMVKLLPGQAESRLVVNNGNGTTTVSYVKIPGFVPAEGTGIFADFYPAFSPSFEGQVPRPDRFGSLTISYTFQNNG